MQLFAGINTVPVLDALTPKTGYGVWPGPLEAQDSDLRNAANLMTMGETLTDRTNFIGWRLPNYIDGGTQQVFGTVIMNGNGGSTSVEWIGVPTLYGAMPITYLTTVTVTDEAVWTRSGSETLSAFHVLVGSTSTVSGTAASPTTVTYNGDNAYPSTSNNKIVLTNGAAIVTDLNSVIDAQGPIRRTGTSSVNVLRPEVLAPTNSVDPFDMFQADTWVLPAAIAADVTLTFGSGFVVGPCEATFYMADQSMLGSHNYSIDFGFGAVITFDHNKSNTASVTIRWTGLGGHFIVVASGGDITQHNAAGLWG